MIRQTHMNDHENKPQAVLDRPVEEEHPKSKLIHTTHVTAQIRTKAKYELLLKIEKPYLTYMFSALFVFLVRPDER